MSIAAQANSSFRDVRTRISIEDSLLGIVFAIAGASLFLPNTSIQLYGYAINNYALALSLATLAAGYATNDSDLSLESMDQIEMAAVAGTGAVLAGNEFSTTIQNLIATNEYTQIGALLVTFGGWFVIALK